MAHELIADASLPDIRARIARDGNRGDDADDCHDNHQPDEREPAASYPHVLRKRRGFVAHSRHVRRIPVSRHLVRQWETATRAPTYFPARSA
jgi:hypothetical protein